MREVKNIETVEIRPITIKITCDGCGKPLDERNAYEEKTVGNPYGFRKKGTTEVKYFRVATSHSDWGGDSGDSYESREYCESCIEKSFSKYLLDCKTSRTQEYEVEQEVGFIL